MFQKYLGRGMWRIKDPAGGYWADAASPLDGQHYLARPGTNMKGDFVFVPNTVPETPTVKGSRGGEAPRADFLYGHGKVGPVPPSVGTVTQEEWANFGQGICAVVTFGHWRVRIVERGRGEYASEQRPPDIPEDSLVAIAWQALEGILNGEHPAGVLNGTDLLTKKVEIKV